MRGANFNPQAAPAAPRSAKQPPPSKTPHEQVYRFHMNGCGGGRTGPGAGLCVFQWAYNKRRGRKIFLSKALFSLLVISGPDKPSLNPPRLISALLNLTATALLHPGVAGSPIAGWLGEISQCFMGPDAPSYHRKYSATGFWPCNWLIGNRNTFVA